jgi:alanine racemase
MIMAWTNDLMMHSRHTRIVIDLEAIRFNYQYLKNIAIDSKVIAVIKADAYGHGSVEVARALPSADAFAVATVAEAMLLRQAGIQQKILVLGGPVNDKEMQLCFAHRLDPVVHQLWQIELLQGHKDQHPIDVWVKFNSGMGRLGFSTHHMDKVIERLNNIAAVDEVRLMTHLANADDVEDLQSGEQIERVTQLGLDDYEWGIANSAGILGWPVSQRRWVRAGIALYGSDPLLEQSHAAVLKPAMHFKSEIIAINTRKQGERIGYSGLYICQDDQQIAVVGAGYADGYPRHLMNGYVTIDGVKADIVGRISMDMITIDVTGLDVKPGDEVTLWGADPLASDIARFSETIPYELFCHAGCHGQREYINKS